MGAESKLMCLTNAPILVGVETALLSEAQGIGIRDTISRVYLDDPWWGIMDLTVETYNAVTYAAYTAAAPPAFGQIMFDATRANFKCGTDLWWGKLMAYITPVGSRVLVS